MTLRVVVVDAFVDLPQVQVVGLQAAERLFELPHRLAFVTAVRTYLRHEKDAIPPIYEALAHDLFGLPS